MGIEVLMTLAVILIVFGLAAAPQPAILHTQPRAVTQQATQPQEDAPQPGPQERPAQPAPQPDSAAKPQAEPQEATPAQPPASVPAPAPDATQPPEPSQPSATAGAPASKPAPVSKSRKHAKKVTPPGPPSEGPTKTVVRNGSTADPQVQLSTGVSREQASRQRRNTNQLLEKTEANLKNASVRQLDDGQQDMVKQIRAYMDQAKAAAGAGDLQRAHNLAVKAQLLSEELLHH